MVNYLNGLSFPNKESRESLCKVFGVTIEEFDAQFGIATIAPAEIDELCRDIRSLNSTDFAKVAQVVFDRAVSELQDRSSPPSA